MSTNTLAAVYNSSIYLGITKENIKSTFGYTIDSLDDFKSNELNVKNKDQIKNSSIEYSQARVDKVGDFNEPHLLYFAMISDGEIILDSTRTMKMKNIQKLNEIAKLPMNWNEGGASAFQNSLISICRTIVSLLPYQPEIFPTAADSIQMEYEKDSGEYLEFNVSDSGIEIFKINDDNSEETRFLELSEQEKLKKVVSDFYA